MKAATATPTCERHCAWDAFGLGWRMDESEAMNYFFSSPNPNSNANGNPNSDNDCVKVPNKKIWKKSLNEWRDVIH